MQTLRDLPRASEREKNSIAKGLKHETENEEINLIFTEGKK